MTITPSTSRHQKLANEIDAGELLVRQNLGINASLASLRSALNGTK